MTRKITSKHPAGDPSCCCCDCRGLFGPIENYHSLSLAHVGIDLTEVQVPETPGSARCIEIIPRIGTPGDAQYRIRPLLTPNGGTPRNAQAEDYRGLECQLITRRELMNYLYLRSYFKPCFPVWPWAYADPDVGGPLRAGGDVLGFLPECFDPASVAVDELHAYTFGQDRFFPFDHWPSLTSANRHVLGSAWMHADRAWLPDDWLLVVFDGDVEIDPPNTGWLTGQGYPPEYTDDIYFDESDTVGGDVQEGPSPFFRIDGQWYVRTVRIEPMGDWLMVSTGEIKEMTKQTADTTAAFDFCTWVDEDGRAAITYSEAFADGSSILSDPITSGGAIGELYPSDVEKFLAQLPWDEHPATKRLPWLFMNLNDEPFRNSAGESLNLFTGFDPTEVSVMLPAITVHTDYLDDNSITQELGQSGYMLTPTENDWYNCMRQCDIAVKFSAHVYEADGSEVQSFGMRRLTVEDMEQMQDVFNGLIRTDYFLDPEQSHIPQVLSRSLGFEAFIGESPTGAIVVVAPNAATGINAFQGLDPRTGVASYQYVVAWLWPDPDNGDLRTNVLGLNPFPDLRVSETFVQCNPLHYRVGVAGTRRVIVDGGPLTAVMEEDDTLVSILFAEDGIVDEVEPPAVMGPYYARIVSSIGSPLTTFQQPGSGSDFILAEVDGVERWLEELENGAWIRGLDSGSHTLYLPYDSVNWQIRYVIINACTGDFIQRDANPVTFDIDGCAVDIYISFVAAGSPDDDDEGDGAPVICSFFHFTDSDPCGGYGYGMAMRPGAALEMAQPITLNPFDPDAEVQS